MISPGYLLIDLKSTQLDAEERELLAHPSVAGVILFARNYANREQLAALCASIYAVRSPLIICVDQEGGRVQRFKEGFTELPSMRELACDYKYDAEVVKLKLDQAITTQLSELKSCGINLNLAPVLDLDDGVSAVIGERSLGASAEQVIDLAQVVLAVHARLNMPSVAKHFPGHGGVSADSHTECPVDMRSITDIESQDLSVYKTLSPFLDAVMTSHVQFPSIDEQVSTFSRFWLKEVLRNRLNFRGVIFSDDLSMQGASKYNSSVDRCYQAMVAGCDCLLLCNNREATVSVIDQLTLADIPFDSHRVQHWVQSLRGPWHDELHTVGN